MYNTEEPESRGPYYVPWKKTSMDFYNKIKESDDDSHYANTRYKSLDGYITGSTIGNVPVKDTESEKEKDNNSANTEDNK